MYIRVYNIDIYIYIKTLNVHNIDIVKKRCDLAVVFKQSNDIRYNEASQTWDLAIFNS